MTHQQQHGGGPSLPVVGYNGKWTERGFLLCVTNQHHLLFAGVPRGGGEEDGALQNGIQSVCHASLSSLMHYINIGGGGGAEDANVSWSKIRNTPSILLENTPRTQGDSAALRVLRPGLL